MTDPTPQQRKPREQRPTQPPLRGDALTIIPFGGMGEIGKNITAYRYEDEIILVDGGLAFPESTHPGVDIVLPQIDHLLEHAHLIKGWFITHGHEDHIGGLPYLLTRLPKVPLYGGSLTLGLISEKLSEFGIKDVPMHEITDGQPIRFGKHFVLEPFCMTHSIPDNHGYVLKTPVGQVVHTGDFKIDPEPGDDRLSDLSRLKRAGDEGVLLLLSDSTNAERPGRSPSEGEIAKELEAVIKNCRGRVFLTTFASQVLRLQNILNIAHKLGRRVVVEGRSMVKYLTVAQERGYLQTNDPFLTSDQAAYLQDSQLLYLCTGSQGQPMSVLSRLAAGNHSKLSLKRGDSVLLSSNPIPGNEEAVNTLINRLYEIGTDVYYPPSVRIHASGHASQDELTEVLALVRPKYFLPCHGEPRHQINHARLAMQGEEPPRRTLIVKNGDIIQLLPDEFKVVGTTPADPVFVDGLGVGDVGEETLQERLTLSADGLVVATAVLSPVPQVHIVTRGFARHNPTLEREMRRVALESLQNNSRGRMEDVRDDLHGQLRRWIRKATGRSPMIVPIVVE